MISLRFLRRSPGLENETDIQFRDSKRGRGEEGHPLFFYFLLDTDGAVILCQRGLAVLQEVDDLIPIVTQRG